MKVLVTGFDPFGGEKVNPAFEAVKMLPDIISGAEIVKREIPTVFDKGADVTIEFIKELKPDLIINVGQAGGRSQICLEKVAINLQEARIADNEGRQPVNAPVRETGETAYFTTVPVKAMTKNLMNHGIPAAVSYSAGTYVCNDVMYRIAHYIKLENISARSGFIHVPYAAEQVIAKPAGTPSMSLKMIADGLLFAIETAVSAKGDIDAAMGEIM